MTYVMKAYEKNNGFCDGFCPRKECFFIEDLQQKTFAFLGRNMPKRFGQSRVVSYAISKTGMDKNLLIVKMKTQFRCF
jgi:hypothetical protein